MPARTRLQRERERRAAESPDAREIRLQRRRQRRAATSPGHRQATLRRVELGELDLQVADKPVNLAHTHLTMLCIHLVIISNAHTHTPHRPQSPECRTCRSQES